MNLSTLRSLLPLSLLAMFGSIGLMAQDSAYFKIPFDFTVGKRQLFAGDYLVGRAAPSVLNIRTASGEGIALVLANTGSPSTLPGKSVLTFDKIGNRYFLSKWSTTDHGLQLIPSEVQKELLAKQNSSRKPLTVVASSLK